MVVEDIAYVGIVEGTVDGIANEEGLEQYSCCLGHPVVSYLQLVGS